MLEDDCAEARVKGGVNANEDKFRVVFEHAPDGCYLSNLQGVLLDGNLAAEKITSYDRHELIGKNFLHANLLYPRDIPRAVKLLALNVMGKDTGPDEFTLRRKDGNPIPVEIRTHVVEVDGEKCILGIARDVTERHRAEEKLRLERDKAHSYLKVASVMIVGIDADERISLLNPRGGEILGCHPEKVLGKNWFDTFIPEAVREAVRDGFHRLLAGDVVPVEYFENPVVTAGGEERIIAWHNAVTRDASGNIVSTLSSGEDITEKRRAQEEREALEVHLRQQQKLESVGTLAGGVAHEINNPINGVMNYAQLILDRADADTEIAGFAGEIICETERVATIVRNLLRFAREEKRHRAPANVVDIVTSTLSLVRALIRTDHAALDVDVSNNLPQVTCNSQQIQQVLMSLLTNARDALHEKYPDDNENKRILVTAKKISRDGRLFVRTTVEDHGNGIAEDVQDRIFDPFYTTRSRGEGTGLGLAISHGIVKDHDGELTFESEAGKYSRFHVDLPVD